MTMCIFPGRRTALVGPVLRVIYMGFDPFLCSVSGDVLWVVSSFLLLLGMGFCSFFILPVPLPLDVVFCWLVILLHLLLDVGSFLVGSWVVLSYDHMVWGVGLFVIGSVWTAYSSTLISATQPTTISGFVRASWDIIILVLGYFRQKGSRFCVSSERHVNLARKCNPWTHDAPARGWTYNLGVSGVPLLPTEPPGMLWNAGNVFAAAVG